MPSYLLTLCILLEMACVGFAQTSSDSIAPVVRYVVNQKRYISVLAGYHYRKHHFAELGVAVNQYGRKGHHPTAWAYFVSSEIKIDNKLLIGPKIGAWVAGGQSIMALGINLIYYTNFEQSSLRLECV